jgi:hypothetical protein
MHVNGRLTAPPLLEVALVTNSVCGMLHQGTHDTPLASGSPLEDIKFGSRLPRAQTVRRALGLASRLLLPVAAPHLLSAPWEAAAAS